VPVDIIQTQIKKFLNNKEAEVLSINGKWGVGKTHLWNKTISENQPALSSYSYVSLFGINSIDELKIKIFENKVDTNHIEQKKKSNTVKERFLDLKHQMTSRSKNLMTSNSKLLSDVFNVNPFFQISDKVFTSLAELALNEMIICFDDLERIGDKLTVKDFLGLASYLKEQKKCKIVIILNEDNIEGSKNNFKKYSEKVIDKHLKFEPSVECCFDIAKPSYEDEPDIEELYQYMKNLCKKANLSNIRIITKLKKTLKDNFEYIKKYEKNIQKQYVELVVTFNLSYYCSESNNQIPPFEYTKKSYQERKEDNNDKKNKEIWESFIENQYDYFHDRFDKLDKLAVLVSKSIENGFTDEIELVNLFEAKKIELDAYNRSESLKKGWNIYHGSFNDNLSELVDAWEEGLRESVRDTSTNNYSQVIMLLHRLGLKDKAIEWTKFYIKENIDRPEIFNIEHHNIHGFGLYGEEFKAALSEASKTYKPTKEEPITILEAYKNKSSNTHSSYDSEIASDLSKDKLKSLFKENPDYVRACHILGRSSSVLMKNTLEALREISNESTINEVRLSRYDLFTSDSTWHS